MKRNFDSTFDTKYTVIETIEDDSAYVQFLPHLWLVPVENAKLVERTKVKFYFPLRMKNQTKDSYLKFVKHAKFICMKPEKDDKWELRHGRILKMGLGTLEEAISAEKLFSDYFSTTEAEMEFIAPAPKICIRKKKKVAAKAAAGSDSDEESQDAIPNFNNQFATQSTETETITDFNNQFAMPSQNMLTLDQQNNFELSDINRLIQDTIFALEDDVSMLRQTTSNAHSDGLADPSNETFMTLNVPVIEGIQIEESGGDAEIEVTTDDISDQRTDCVQSSCCTGHQKIMNKIDYVHKKFSKQFSLVHQENAANRKLILCLLELTTKSTDVTDVMHDSQFEGNEDETTDEINSKPIRLDVVELDGFHAKYKETFPIQSSDVMIEFNKSMKLDQKFLDSLFFKLSQIVAEDETKATRKILNELCGFRCLKDFTWHGTKKMKSFEGLHLVIELMTKLLEEKFPGCKAMETIMKVVKQRTKSAKESWTNYLEKKGKQSATLGAESGGAAGVAVCNHSTTTAPETNDVQSAANSIGDNISTTSERETIPETDGSIDEANGSDLKGDTQSG